MPCCAFRVHQRAIAQMRKIKTFQLAKLQSPHHRKPLKRRVSAPEWMLTEWPGCLPVIREKSKQGNDSANVLKVVLGISIFRMYFAYRKQLFTINRELWSEVGTCSSRTGR